MIDALGAFCLGVFVGTAVFGSMLYRLAYQRGQLDSLLEVAALNLSVVVAQKNKVINAGRSKKK